MVCRLVACLAPEVATLRKASPQVIRTDLALFLSRDAGQIFRECAA